MLEMQLEALEALSKGLILTFGITVGSLSIGFILAILWVYCLGTHQKALVAPIRGLITFTRGVPLLVQLFLFYYGLPQLLANYSGAFVELLQHPLFCAVSIFSINSSAYVTVLLENNLNTISKGEKEVSHVLGVSYFSYMKHIGFPRIFANFSTVYSNEVVMILKSTSLVGTITLIDLMTVTKDLIAKTYQPLEFLFLAGVLYLLVATLILSLLKPSFIILNIKAGWALGLGK